MSQSDQTRGDVLHEGHRTADIDLGFLIGWKASHGEQRVVNSAAMSGPSFGGLARQGMDDAQVRIGAPDRLELLSVDDVIQTP